LKAGAEIIPIRATGDTPGRQTTSWEKSQVVVFFSLLYSHVLVEKKFISFFVHVISSNIEGHATVVFCSHHNRL
jgi:hypothetical protein